MKIVSKDKSSIISVRLFDLSGRLVRDFKTNGSNTYDLNLGPIPAGAYMINVVTTTKTISSQVIVTH